VYADEFTEVSDDVISNGVGSIRTSLDNSQFDIGIFRSASVRITLDNSKNTYSGTEQAESIFRIKRRDSLVKITWEPGDEPLSPGFFGLDEEPVLSEEVTVFEGLISDDQSNEKPELQQITFNILGLDVLFSRVEIPFSSLTGTDTWDDIFFKSLNQSPITDLLTVDAANINSSINSVPDDLSGLENKTVTEMFKRDLLAANSVVRIEDGVVKVSSRDATADVKHNFYGPASENGIENISNIDSFNDGINRMFNLLTWREATNSYRDNSAILQYGLKKKEVSNNEITDSTKIDTVLTAIGTEFGIPKRQFNLSTPVTPEVLALNLLDRVNVDSPAQTELAEGESEFPYYGSAVYGTARYPTVIPGIVISNLEDYKIINKRVNLNRETIDFELREI